MWSRPVALTVAVAAFVLGGFAASTPAFDIDAPLTAGDVLNALMTVLIAIVLGVMFQKNFSEDRVEKDLLIAQGQDIVAAVKEVRVAFLEMNEGTPPPAADRRLMAALRLLSYLISSLDRAAASCQTDYQDVTLETARVQLRTYRKALTERLPDQPTIHGRRVQ